MPFSAITNNWPRTIAFVLLAFFLFWGYGCPARVPSLMEPEKKVTRPELQIELTSIMSTAEYRLADLDKQEAFRDIIFQNALLVIDGGTINPAGIITLLAGLYGVTRGGSDIVKRVKKPPTV